MAMTVEDFKAAIIAYVGANDRCTFPDLVAAIPGAEGEHVAELPGPNVILWGPLADEMVTALKQLFHGHELFYVPAETLLPYIAAGAVLNLPIARSAHHIGTGYVTPHWLPVVLTLRHPMPERAEADFAEWARADAERAAR